MSTPANPDPSPFVPRRVLPILLVAQFCGTSLWFATNAVMPALQAAHGWPAQAAASLTSFLQGGFILGTLFFAVYAVADRFSPRRVFLACSLGGAACTLASGWWSHDLTALKACRVAAGFCLAGIYPVGMKIAAQWYRLGLGSALGWLLGALILGSAVAHGINALAVWGLGLDGQMVFPAVAALVAFGGVLQMVALPDAPTAVSTSGPTAQPFDWRALATLWTDRRLRCSAFAYFGHMWELYTMWVAIPVVLSTRLPADQVSWITFLVLGSGAISCVIGGHLSGRWGSASVGGTFLGLSGLCCLAAPWMLQAPDGLFYGWLLLWGLTVSSDSPQFSALTARNAPPHAVGSVLTLTNCIGFSISILSIELFSSLQGRVPFGWLLACLAVGPAAGLLMIRPLLVREGMSAPPIRGSQPR